MGYRTNDYTSNVDEHLRKTERRGSPTKSIKKKKEKAFTPHTAESEVCVRIPIEYSDVIYKLYPYDSLAVGIRKYLMANISIRGGSNE